MRKEYTINELAEILGCSRTAIVKKIKPDEDNPAIKRYKGVHDVVTSRGQMAILLDDRDLEKEKSMSKGANNVLNETANTQETEDIIDVEPEKTSGTNETLLNLTERYIDDVKTLQKQFYEELRNRDNQINLLTTSEKNKENEYLRAQAENKTLKLHNKVLKVLLSIIVTVSLIFITVYITSVTIQNTLSENQQNVTQENLQTPVKAPVKNKK